MSDCARGLLRLAALGLEPGARVLVYGLGRSGVAAVDLLVRLGLRVLAVDRRPAESFPSEWLSDRTAAGVELRLGADPERIPEDVALVVLSPGVPTRLEPLDAARDRGTPVIGEVELAWRLSDSPYLAVTGTNGKSTVTAWLGEVLRAAGRDVLVAGNIGDALCGHVSGMTAERLVVAEVSSYQLETVECFRPWIAVWLNLTPDHLGRHGDMAGYARAKARIFARQRPEDWLVVNGDDPWVREWAGRAAARRLWFSRRTRPSPGLYLADGALSHDDGEHRRRLLESAELPLAGVHNLENALAVSAAALAAGVPLDALRRGLRRFRGLPHRLQWCGRIGRVDYFDDSKATNVDAAIHALRSFERPVVWIAGGEDKGSPLEPLVECAARRVRSAVLIGRAAERFAAALAPRVAVERAVDMAQAVQRAAALAQPGDVVLLSPACASFDMYRDFEERGAAFQTEVRRLPGYSEPARPLATIRDEE